MDPFRNHCCSSRLRTRHETKQCRVHRIDFVAVHPHDAVAEHRFTLWIPYWKAVVTFDDKFIRNADVVA